MQRQALIAAASLSAAAAAAPAGAVEVITDSFELDSSANYTLVATSSDNTSDFNFDYVAAGIPLAPRSAAGGGTGLRLTANDVNGSADAITAFNNVALSDVGAATLTVDVYLNVDGNSSGTTEAALVGIAGDGTTPNSTSGNTGSGSFVSFNGDGDAGALDYQYFVEGAGIVDPSDPSYLAGSADASADLYTSIFPDSQFVGSPGNQWTTLRVSYNGGSAVSYSLDGVTIFDTTLSDAALDNQLTSFAGFVSLGLNDVFGSVADPFQAQFVVYDNLVVDVDVVPEPASLALAGLAGGMLLLRRRAA